jgi:hypothetical protein
MKSGFFWQSRFDRVLPSDYRATPSRYRRRGDERLRRVSEEGSHEPRLRRVPSILGTAGAPLRSSAWSVRLIE